MISDEDMIKFHNGDTLDSIPVITDALPVRGEGISNRQLWVLTLVVALAAGAATGLALAARDNGSRVPVAAPTPVRSPTPSVLAAPTVTATETVTAPPTVVARQPYGTPDIERVLVMVTPSTGGDPGTNFCFAYTGAYESDAPSAVLLANAPAYQCHDFLFSAHPSDMEGVFEDAPPDCSATPGGRTAEVITDEATYWGYDHWYTCLLLNDGA